MALSPTSSRVSSAASGSVTLLTTTTLASPGTFDIQNIDQTYTDLILECMLRGTNASVTDNLRMRINNDSGAGYTLQQLSSIAASSTSTESLAQTSLVMGQIASANATGTAFTSVEITFPSYTSTSWLKTGVVRISMSIGQSTTNTAVYQLTILYNSTSALSRVALFGNLTANLATGSVVRVYGRT